MTIVDTAYPTCLYTRIFRVYLKYLYYEFIFYLISAFRRCFLIFYLTFSAFNRRKAVALLER